ncbi:D-serine ammonia-lyase [Pseudomaricurvus alcaniphilus]|uniref:D-serine ammonia-lyase n=1 Tax=Pseudomaricurvus alcaniphilus TaxID=1166482 RepID=UPI0014074277|nr:D-serine ammonia-lyase [Pseudomaricurvus alcaniphilus]NHN36119.1 D-serine ammonia-lyase [Pseudomaricurvus alcaniphilus]
MDEQLDKIVASLQRGLTTTWLRAQEVVSAVPGVPGVEIDAVMSRFARFEPLLARLFPEAGWDGRVCSPLLRYPARVGELESVWVKADHLLPMTGSVKARGGVYELLCALEDFAAEDNLLPEGADLSLLLEPGARAALARRRVVVASTGNLGFSIGLVARAFGVNADVHMSADAKQWKKERLRALGATVIEHAGDYEQAVAVARAECAASGAYFIDDERSRRLFAGYSAAGRELAAQLVEAGVSISKNQPLVVYLPCGVGGAPGGIMAGLLREFGDALIVVFVEPVASACMLLALASGRRQSVYQFGLDNHTIADGLAVPTASQLALDLIGARIDAVVAVPDDAMLDALRKVWGEAQLRLEPSAAAAFVALEPFIAARAARGDRLEKAVHVVWTTGGSLLPDSEFLPLINPDR